MSTKRMSLRTTMSLVVFLAIAGAALLLYIPWFLVGQRDVRNLTHVANSTVLHDLTLRIRFLLEDTEGVFDILRYDMEHPEINLSAHRELFLFALLSDHSFTEIGYIDEDHDYWLLRRLADSDTFAFSRFRPDPADPVSHTQAELFTLTSGDGDPVPTVSKAIAVPNPLRAAWYHDVRHAAGGVVWTNFHVNRETNVLKTTYARRFTNGEGRDITAYIRIHLDPPDDAILSLRSGVDLNLFLLNRTGRILTHAGHAAPTQLEGELDVDGDGIPDNRLAMVQDWAAAHLQGFAKMVHPLQEEIIDPITSQPYTISLHPVRDTEWIIGTILPSDVLARYVAGHFYLQAWLLPLLALGALILTMVSVRRFLGRPMEALRSRIDRLQDLDFSAPATDEVHFSILELHEMNEAVNRMDTALRSFRTYIPADLIRQQMHAGQAARLGCSARTLTILRTRIADWDALLAMEDSHPLLSRYPAYLEAITTSILAHGGTIDAFIDGTLHAFFGAPTSLPHQERQACRAVLRAQDRLRTLNDKWVAEGLPSLHTHFALHTGEALVGNIGTPARMSYSAIGDAVRMTGTLSRHHDRYGAVVILSDSTLHATGDTFRARPLDRLPMRGDGEVVELFELLGEGAEQDALSEQEERVRPYRMGYRAYWDGDYVQAMTYLQEFLHACPGDTAALLYLHRCEEKQKQVTGPNWSALTAPHPDGLQPRMP